MELYITGDVTPDFRFALTDREQIIDGKVYLPAGFSRPQIRKSINDDVSSTSMVLPDVGAAIASILESTELGGSRLVLRQTTMSGIAAGESIVAFEGRISSLVIDLTTVNINVDSLVADPNGLITVPRRTYGNRCEHRFGDPWCTVDQTLHQYLGSFGPGSNRVRIVDPGFTQDQFERTWDPAYIKFTSGININQARAVANIQPGAIFLRKPFYTASAPGDTFILQRHCPRTMAGCVAFSNESNYGGCPDQPKKPRNIVRPPITLT